MSRPFVNRTPSTLSYEALSALTVIALSFGEAVKVETSWPSRTPLPMFTPVSEGMSAKAPGPISDTLSGTLMTASPVPRKARAPI